MLLNKTTKVSISPICGEYNSEVFVLFLRENASLFFFHTLVLCVLAYIVYNFVSYLNSVEGSGY